MFGAYCTYCVFAAVSINLFLFNLDFVKKQTSQSIILPADLNEHEETIKVSQAVLPEMKVCLGANNLHMTQCI